MCPEFNDWSALDGAKLLESSEEKFERKDGNVTNNREGRRFCPMDKGSISTNAGVSVYDANKNQSKKAVVRLDEISSSTKLYMYMLQAKNKLRNRSSSPL